MEKFVIHGQNSLKGTVSVSGSKNSALPILAACILSDNPIILENIPDLSDINIMLQILFDLGCCISRPSENTVTVQAKNIQNPTVSYRLAGKLRGSFLVMGPLLARCGYAGIAMPGGCAIGARPVDLHLKGLAALGAEINNCHGAVIATAKTLTGAKIYLDFPSVGATENILCAATTAQGETIIENAAAEPEIVDLANFLSAMGAHVTGAGTDTITIRGVSSLGGNRYRIMPDRIEAGTLLAAAAITGGEVTVTDMCPEDVKPMTAKLAEMNLPLLIGEDFVTIKSGGDLTAIDIKTLPYPGFPTDMQAPMSALLSRAEGTAIITETIFENRFMHIGELNRMGASIKVAGRCAVIEGKKALTGTKVRATDLRAGAALVLAGLSAKGDTEISDIYHIERGYMNLDKKLRQLGADITKENDPLL